MQNGRARMPGYIARVIACAFTCLAVYCGAGPRPQT